MPTSAHRHLHGLKAAVLAEHILAVCPLGRLWVPAELAQPVAVQCTLLAALLRCL